MWYLITYPYIELAIAIGVLFTNMGMTSSIYPPGNALIIILEILLIVAPYLATLIVSLRAKAATPGSVFAVKAAHIPFYLFAFALGFAMSITVMGLPVTFAMFFADVFTIVPSGIYMCRMKKANIPQKLLGFVFVADVVTAFVIWRENKKKTGS